MSRNIAGAVGCLYWRNVRRHNMRLWVAENDSGVQVNFHPESASESHVLDSMLKFTSGISKPISSERDRTVAMGATSIAALGGHETKRWIFIPKIQHSEVTVEVERFEVPLDPAIDVFQVAVRRGDGVWRDTCASEEMLRMFLRGVQAGAENPVSLPEYLGEGIKWRRPD
jgi:hypothetical protein